jgi:hypothetical protein
MMNEAEWLSCADARAMLPLAARWRAWEMSPAAAGPTGPALSERKATLFLAACVRNFWDSLPGGRHGTPVFRDAVEAAERHVDPPAGQGSGLATFQAASDASDAATRDWVILYNHRTAPSGACPESVARRASYASTHLAQQRNGPSLPHRAAVALDYAHPHETDGPRDTAFQAHLLRCVAGNPFRPVALGHRLFGAGRAEDMEDTAGPGGCVDTSRVTPAVRGLALAAYEDRTPQGWLDPVRLAVLADALEEAGADGGRGGRALLWSLRGFDWCPGCAAGSHGSEQFCGGRGYDGRHGWVASPWPRVRGYWALDMLLGKL